MIKKVVFYSLLFFPFIGTLSAQTGTDTLHYRKVYYFGGTGLGIPLGATKRTLSTQLFTSSLGLDISLKKPQYFLLPTVYTMGFKYDQLINDDKYNRILEDGTASIYALSIAGGIRKQINRLNMYAYTGPSLCLDVESRIQDLENGRSKMDKLYALSPAVKIGLGSDYKFRGFYLGLEFGYLHHFRDIQNTPVHVMTIMVGLKSDITNFSEKVIDLVKKQ